MTSFWNSVIVLGVVVLAVIVVEMADRWFHVMWPRDRNRHLTAREQQLQADAIQEAQEAKERARLDRLFPPMSGPKGFAGQVERRARRRHSVTKFNSKVN